ncbi:MAG: histidine kinase, partial [Nitrospirae bacterium]
EVRCNGSVFLVTSKRITLPDERKATLFVMRDMTEMRQLQEQLYYSDKLASLGMLVSGVAHEINNPLTGVMGYTELLLTKTEDGSLRETLQKIYHSAERCKKIVENLLAFARQRPPQKAPVLVNELIENTLELRAYWLRSNNIEIQKDFQSMPYIKADPQQLQQVFLNLIINAEDAIMASGKDEKLLKIRTSYDEPNQRIVVEFEDNGIGIPEDILQRIFDPFFTTKPVGKGTGLGLSISHGIITEHGGLISAKSTPGQGTVFRIELPVERQE